MTEAMMLWFLLGFLLGGEMRSLCAAFGRHLAERK
jgi:hypothetical protein